MPSSRFPLWILLPTLAGLVGCGNSPTGEDKRISLVHSGWVFQNAAPDMGLSSSLSVDVSVTYQGANLVASDISRATFSAGGVTWNLLSSPTWLNDSTKRIADGWQNFVTSAFSTNGSVLPLGAYSFDVLLTDADEAKFTTRIPAPGTRDTSGGFVYDEDYNGQVTSGFHRMLQRPVALSASKAQDSILVSFSTTDSMAYGGWIWAYDSARNYLGRSTYFRNYATKAISSVLNQASELHLDGTPNRAAINSTDWTMNTGRTVGEIRSVRVVLTDGRQYIATSQTYDCRSIGTLQPLN